VWVYGCIEHAHVDAFDNSYTQIPVTIQAYFNGTTTTNTNGDFDGTQQTLPAYQTVTIQASNSSNLFRYIELTAKDDGSRNRIYSSSSGGTANWTDNSDYNVNGFDFMPKCTPLQYASFFMQDKTTILNQINSMSAAGPTRNDVGLAWGWFSLSPNWRGTNLLGSTTEPQNYNTSVTTKAAIIMTQGDNVGTGVLSPNPYDQNFLNICTAMKAKGITLYTVAYSSSQNVINLLAQCASPGDAYTASNASQLSTAFTNIGTTLVSNKLRVSQ
jgi:hypothetical protein